MVLAEIPVKEEQPYTIQSTHSYAHYQCSNSTRKELFTDEQNFVCTANEITTVVEYSTVLQYSTRKIVEKKKNILGTKELSPD